MLMAEMATAVKLKLPIKIILLKNNSLAEVRFEQKELGNPEFGCELSPIDFAAFAPACSTRTSRPPNPWTYAPDGTAGHLVSPHSSPSYQRLRPDRNPEDVGREVAEGPPIPQTFASPGTGRGARWPTPRST